MDLHDRVAIVTGAGRGLGRSHALALARKGAAVVVNDLGLDVHGGGEAESAAQTVVNEIEAAGGVALANLSSVATPEGGEEIVAAAIDAFGRVDIVVNNAGILRDRTFAKLAPEDLRAVLAVHLEGAFFVSQPAFRHMREQGYGRLVFTSSASGIFGSFGQANYGAAKMGLVGLVNVLAIEGERHGVKANAIAPLASTRMTGDLLGEVLLPFAPEDVTPVVEYFASEQCEVTGEVWSVAAGSVSRVFMGAARGYVKSSSVLTAEEVAANVSAIRDIGDFSAPDSLQAEIERVSGLVGHTA